MSAFQSTSIGMILATLASSIAMGGSTCHGQSGSGDVAKDPGTSPDVNLPGVDTSPLTPREKREWSGYVSEFLAPCSDVPVSIAQCVLEKRPCSKCLPAARFVLKGVRDGMSREQVEKSYRNRFDASLIKDVALGDAPSKGPAGAPITIVEFADFECPYCAIMAPRLEETFNKRSGQIRFAYKFMPLSGHPHSDIAARAAIAALDQGKFWEMHDKLFANRDHLEQPDLDGYAKDLGLDMTRFQKDAASQATTDRIAADRKQADTLGVVGTPTIYINGREFDPQNDLTEWLALELGADGKTTTTSSPSPTGSAAGQPPAPTKPGASAQPAPKK
jgi:protein-disulfide isomerase